LGNQSEMNRQLAVVDAEVSNALSIVHTAPFETIGQELISNGFTAVGGFAYRKNLSVNPSNLPNGQITVTLVGAVAAPNGGNPVLPDPLTLNVTISWDMAMSAPATRTFASVRTR
jgi:hypothetical protein